jgi:hypothetical protein
VQLRNLRRFAMRLTITPASEQTQRFAEVDNAFKKKLHRMSLSEGDMSHRQPLLKPPSMTTRTDVVWELELR